MDRSRILEFIGEEISRLEKVKELLGSENGIAALHPAGPRLASGPKKRILSEDARNRIAQAQKRRWAKQRRESLLAKKAS
jgi:hypothetical protein